MVFRSIIVCMLITVDKEYVKCIVKPRLLEGFSTNILDDIFIYVCTKNIHFFKINLNKYSRATVIIL